jgi:hypothetical protein
VLLGAVVAALSLLAIGPATATITPPGSCVATGDFEPGGPKSAAEAEIEIPQESTVTWFGAVTIPEPSAPREVNGFVALELPAGQRVTLGEWPSSGTQVENSGVYEYEITNLIAGIPMTFYGEHYEQGTLFCSGQVEVTVEGTNPLNVASVALLVVSFIGLSLAVIATDSPATHVAEVKPGEGIPKDAI